MEWINAKYRLPEKHRTYFVRINNTREVLKWYEIDELWWLQEDAAELVPMRKVVKYEAPKREKKVMVYEQGVTQRKQRDEEKKAQQKKFREEILRGKRSLKIY
jgi:hypothetical protein